MRIRNFLALLVGVLLSSTYAFASDDDGDDRSRQTSLRTYEVTIINLTRGQVFTPQLLATHRASVRLFELGQPASQALEILAEGGDTAPLTMSLLDHYDKVSEVKTVAGLLMPGQRVSTRISASSRHRFLSMAAMLIPTNDTFVAVDGLRLPKRGQRSVLALGYDAGTEANDQNCLHIPGPRCHGEGHSPGPNVGDEGYVYVSNGFHELPQAEEGEVLSPQVYDWRNPIARVVVERID